MEILISIILFFPIIFILYKFIIQKNTQQKNLPPSPPSLPILGHFHLLKRPLQSTLQKFSSQYGPIIFLKFGYRPVLLVSTPSLIEECYTKNDTIFANRPQFASRRQLEYNFTTLGMAPYGHHWRNLRRFTVLKIFSSKSVQISSGIRTEEIRFFVKQIFARGGKKMEFKSLFYMLAYNIMVKMVSGERHFDGKELDSEETKHKYDYIKEIFSPSPHMDLGDLCPYLRWLTFFLGGTRKRIELYKKRNAYMQGLIEGNRNRKSSSSSSVMAVMEGEKGGTIIDVMLSLQESEPEFYTDDIIKGIILIMLIAGTETSAMTMEAAASFLISNPDIINKAKSEIDANVEQSRLLEDEDLSNLTYLHCIINETLRLGPTVPIIPPHESSDECTVGGFTVPRGTMLMVNASAVHTDPEVWEDPKAFKPERFEGFKGGFCFIPFGSGRRQCPGTNLAMRLMVLSLGTLIQCFDWEKAEENGLGVDKRKDKPVEIIFSPRKALINALSQL